MEFRRTPLAVESSRIVKTLETLSSCGVTVTAGKKVNVATARALATLAILFL